MSKDVNYDRLRILSKSRLFFKKLFDSLHLQILELQKNSTSFKSFIKLIKEMFSINKKRKILHRISTVIKKLGLSIKVIITKNKFFQL